MSIFQLSWRKQLQVLLAAKRRGETRTLLGTRPWRELYVAVFPSYTGVLNQQFLRVLQNMQSTCAQLLCNQHVLNFNSKIQKVGSEMSF